MLQGKKEGNKGKQGGEGNKGSGGKRQVRENQ
jgi:hypothetical protein